MSFARELLKRFPTVPQMLPVFAVSCSLIYSWTFISFFRSLSVNWILFMRPGEIMGLAAYLLISDFLEATATLLALVLLSGLLPRPALTDQFSITGAVVAVCFLGSLMIYLQFFQIGRISDNVLYWLTGFISGTLLALLVTSSSSALRRAITSVADRCVVFLYLFLPLTGFSLIVAVLRNLY